MPEDYQTILNDLGVDTSAGEGEQTPATETNTTDPNPNANEGEQTPSATNEGNGQGTTANANPNATVESDEQRRANEAFAAMRSENSKYKKLIQHLMRGSNFQGDEDAFINNLTEAAYKRQAQMQGAQVSPELLKRMDSLEAQNKSLIEAQNREMFTSNLKNMQETLKLSDNDIKEFVSLAVREHIDLTIPGTNFVTLYQGLFFDKLKDKMIEDERQKWIAQNNKADNASKPDGKSGKKDPEPTNVNTMAEFDSLLQSIPSNKK